MMDRALCELKEIMFAPVAERFGGAVRPTTITLIGFVVGIGSSVSAWQGMLGLGLLLWWVNRLLDGLDGVIARTHYKQSDFGGYLDILTDFVIYATVPIGLVLSMPSVELLTTLAFLLSTFYVNACGLVVPVRAAGEAKPQRKRAR